jgi:hypothetical protein
MIGKTIDVSVTSVLQTTAGKMIFGKWDERAAYSRSSAAQPVTLPVVATVAPPPVPAVVPTVVPTAVESKPGSA